MQTILIPGAGTYQLPLIQTAKRMGLRVITVTPPGPYPGIEAADVWYNADTRDYDRILAIARAEHIDGICTSGTDVAVKSIGYVCDQLGLSGISYDAATKCTDKKLMKEAFRDHGVSTAAFEVVYSAEEAARAAEFLGFPVMIKITDSSGSRGVCKVDDPADVDAAYRLCAAATHQDYVLVEKFISGVEIGVDGFVDEAGHPTIILPHGKFIYKAPTTTVPAGHYFPLGYDTASTQAIEKEITKAVTALGLTSCAFNSDVLVRDDGVFIIEMGGRTGATCIPELISLHKGYDWYEKLLLSALGQKVSFASGLQRPCMAKLLVSPFDARISAIDDQRLSAITDAGVAVRLDVGVGDYIHAMSNGTDRFGHVIATDVTETQLDEIIAQIISCLSLEK